MHRAGDAWVPIHLAQSSKTCKTESPESMLAKEDSGERGRNRTYNLLIKSQLLCQLSYAPSPIESAIYGLVTEGCCKNRCKLALWNCLGTGGNDFKVYTTQRFYHHSFGAARSARARFHFQRSRQHRPAPTALFFCRHGATTPCPKTG